MLFRALLLSLILPSFALASAWSDSVKHQIDKNIELNFRNQNSQVGIVVGVIHGEESYVWSYGERVKGNGEAPNGDTFFEMGSITKTFTATLLAKEILEERVSLGTQVKSLWPELSGTYAGEITLEQLATHTSGLPRDPDNLASADPMNPFQGYSEKKLLALLKAFKQRSVGSYPHSYSNVGYGLLGYLLSEKLHRENFGDYIEKNLLGPLGLHDTKTALAKSDLVRSAQGYGNFFELVPPFELGVLNGAGVLRTTVNDLLKYIHFQMRTDHSLLTRAARLTHEPRHPLSGNTQFEVGLAWGIGQSDDFRLINHNGATMGFRASLFFDKSKRTAAVVISNTSMSPSCILAPVFDMPGCQPKTWITVPLAQQRALLGRYRCAELEMDAKVFLENEVLGLELPAQLRLRLWPNSEKEYIIPDADVKIEFQEARFHLTQNGKTYEFQKK